SRSSVVDASSQEFDDVFQVNVKSPMRLAQLAWPHLKAAGEGKIVVMASLAGKRVRYADGGQRGRRYSRQTHQAGRRGPHCRHRAVPAVDGECGRDSSELAGGGDVLANV